MLQHSLALSVSVDGPKRIRTSVLWTTPRVTLDAKCYCDDMRGFHTWLSQPRSHTEWIFQLSELSVLLALLAWIVWATVIGDNESAGPSSGWAVLGVGGTAAFIISLLYTSSEIHKASRRLGMILVLRGVLVVFIASAFAYSAPFTVIGTLLLVQGISYVALRKRIPLAAPNASASGV